MNAVDLLSALDCVPEEYLREASAWEKREKHHPPLLLVAAIAAMVAMLAGCAAAYLIRLGDLKIGTVRYIHSRYIDTDGIQVPETEATRDLLSLQGLAGSPNYLAAREWHDFLEAYVPDPAQQAADFGPEYDAYFVDTRQMADKVTEIAGKYGLELAGERLCAEGYQAPVFLDALGLSSLWQAEAPVTYQFGYLYGCGNFRAELDVSLGDLPVPVTYRYNGKAYFDVSLAGISSGDDCREWTCTLPGGRSALVAMDAEFVRVFCDREDAFLSLEFFCQNLDENGNIRTLTQEDIRQILSCLDWSVVTKQPDIAQVKRKLEASSAGKADAAPEDAAGDCRSYEDVIRKLLESGADPQGWFYAQKDITGDGVPELFLGTETSFGTVKTMANGTAVTLISTGMAHGFALCHGNVLRYTDGSSTSFGKADKDSSQFLAFLQLAYDPWEESWYRTENGITEAVSQAEYDSILEEYPVLDLGMVPIGRYPLS